MGTGNDKEDVKTFETLDQKEERRETDGSEKEPEKRKDTIRQEYGFASDVKLKECRFCCVMIPKKAKICPNCKMSLKNHWFLKTAAAILTVALIAAGSYYLSVYWGLIDDSLIPVWMAKHRVAAPAMSAASIEAAGAGSNINVVEATESDEADSAGEEKQTAAETSAGEEKQAAAETSAGEEKQTAAETSAGEEKQTTAETTAGDDVQMAETASGEKDPQSTEAVSEDDDQQDVSIKGAESVLGKADHKDSTETQSAEAADENEAAFRMDCVQIDYKALLRKQQDYLDTALMIETQVVCQVEGGLFDDNTYYLCMTEDKNGIKRYYIIRDDRVVDDTLILEGDMLTVYGRLFGDCRLPAKLVETRPTVPALAMLYYDLRED